jgi:nucleotide-binding universal stress UspA family protein
MIVPLDGSEISERALKPALAIAEQDGAEVTLIRVPVVETLMVPTAQLSGNYSLRALQANLEKARTEARDYLESLRAAHAQPNLTLKTLMVDGDPAEAILDAAAERAADLIVMSTHGYSGITRWVLGSVTERVLSGAACPVLVIRSEAPLRKLLVALDGSALAEQALPPAIEIAATLGASVVLLRVVKPLPTPYLEELEASEHGLGVRAQDELREEAAAYLRGVAGQYVRPRLEIQTAVRAGEAAMTLVDYAETQGVDILAMATHGRTGVRRWLYGSVTEKVLHNSTGSAMLIVRPSQVN